MSEIVEGACQLLKPYWDETTEFEDIARAGCYFFPDADIDRAKPICAFLALLFKLDDVLLELSFVEGEQDVSDLKVRLKHKGRAQGSEPLTGAMSHVWASMHKLDPQLTDEMLNPVSDFMMAQIDPERGEITDDKAYLEYRKEDVGEEVLVYFMFFATPMIGSVFITKQQIERVTKYPVYLDLFQKTAYHMIAINDVVSYKKECAEAKKSETQGAQIPMLPGPNLDAAEKMDGEGDQN